MTKRPQVDLKHYRRLRAILRRHQNAAVKTVPRTAFRTAARKLGLLEGDKLLLESEGELTILFDFLIYHHRQRGKTLVQRYLAKLPASDDPDERSVREAMASSRFSVYKVGQTHPPTGLNMHDHVRGGTLFVVDEAMSTSVTRGQLFADRLLPLPDYWMTSGAGYPVTLGLYYAVKQQFLPALRRARGSRNLSDLSPAAEDELAMLVTSTAMMQGTTADIEYK